ncbi:tRNA adenosine(34) deaminase TadA [Candidatus Cloacimonadota bacterium]
MTETFTDEYWMQLALQQARSALQQDEVPIGAILVKDNQLVHADHNRTNQLKDPRAHAEKLVIDKVLDGGEKFLNKYTLYVTLEPCLMCAGMLIWSRLGRVVFGASDPKAGVVGSIYNVLQDKSFNHRPKVKSGILEAECASILRDFFRSKR